MRKNGKVVAVLLATGLTLTTIFPQTAYAAEVGSQIKEANASVSTVLEENRDLLETAVKEVILARGGDVSDQILMDQVRSEIVAKIESGEMALKDDTVKEDDSKETDSDQVEVVDHTSADEMLSDENVPEEKVSTRLIVTSDAEPTDFFDAISVDHYDDIWVFTYETAETTNKAYSSFVSAGYTVEKDFSVEAIKEDETPDEDVVSEVTDTEVDDTTEDTVTEERKTIVAVIDTGISDVTNDDVFKDRIIEGTSVISDSYIDDNGHGTAMAKIIAEDTADEPDVMILPIKALDENGKGTVLSVALAIKYAKEHGADVINLSLSGVGQSNILTNAINDCYNNNITVVTAAGNDNADAKDYIPGNVDTAINISAAEEDADGKIVSAPYTNHGDNIDFAALGTYKLVVTKEKTTLETELRGTSIASAHVAAYVALLKQINTTVDGVVNPISESDVMESLKASADDFDGTADKTYFGNGYLTKENLVFKGSDAEDEDKDTDKDETEEDGEQIVGMTASYSELYLDEEDLKSMVSGNDGYYHWLVINPALSGWWEIKFRYNGSYAYDAQIVQDVSSWEPWGDTFGAYCFYVNPSERAEWSNWGLHSVYDMIAIRAYIGSLGGSGGHINVRIDGVDHLDCWSSAMPTVNCYIKGNGVKLVNTMDLGTASWSNKKYVGWGAIFHLHNGTQTLKTRQIHFDGSDHYTWCMSTAANAVYVADGCSYYSYQDEFEHGYSTSVISNHHSNGNTRQYGESYVNIREGNFHDCLVGLGVNNRIDVSKTTFKNCQQAISISGTGGEAGGRCDGGIYGLWNPWGSRGTISDCYIESGLTGTVEGTSAAGINITGSWQDDSRSVNIIKTNINTATNGININPSSYRTIYIENTNAYGNNKSYGIYNNNAKTNIRGGSYYNKSDGIYIESGQVSIEQVNIYSNKYGIENKGTLRFCSNYDYNSYLSKNGDVKNLIQNGTWKNGESDAYNHWITYGMAEGRNASNSYNIDIHDNSSYGIKNSGTLILKGGHIRNNSDTGVYNSGTTNLEFLDDNVNNEPRIYSNRTHGIENHGTVNHYGGYIYSNGNDSTGDGIQNYGTYNMSGGNSDHNKHQGVWNHGKATFNYSGGNIYENGNNGLVNQGTLNVTSYGDIRTNGSAGIYNICGTTNVSNVNIYDNGSYGIFNNANWNNDTTDGLATVNFNSGNIYQNPHGIDSCGSDARTYIKGGTIGTDDDKKKNTIGVYVNGGTTEMTGGTVKNSTENGVEIHDGTMTFSKGTISGNRKYGVYIQNNGSATLNQSADIGTNYNGAVRNQYQGSGHYNLKKGAKCADGSDGKGSGVFLDTKASISITDALTSDIKVASYDRNTGKVVANCSNETVAKSAQDHLVLTGNASFQKTTSNAKQTDDYGKTVVYRQGNGTNGKKTQVIVSQEETTTFDLNLASTGLKDGYISATIKTPSGDKDTVTTTTYWGEYTLPSAQAVAYYDGDVATHFVDALGWAESASGDPKYDGTLMTYAAWGDKTLYAKWKVTFFYLKSDVNSPTDATATGGWGSVQSHSGNNAYAKENTASCDGYSFLGWFTKKDGGEMIYDKDGNIIKNTSLTNKNGRHYYDGDNGKTITLYAHWATIDISNITAKIGSQLVPLGNGDKTVVATYAGQNIYTDSKNSPYASNLYVKTLTRALNGDTAPNIDKIWVKVTNTSDPNQSKEYVLYDNVKGTANYANNSLLDTIGDLPGAMDLTYEIHIKNTYGLEKVAETYTSRKIELYTTIEKVDTDINGEGDNTFSAGTRGILHVYTTGWVDNFNFTFPNDLNASWEFDKSLGYPVLTPSANDVFGFTTNDPNMTKYADKAYPSTIQNVPTLTGYKTYGDTGFIRCYDFYFWIPLTIDNPNNPNAEVVNDDTVWKIKTTARKFYDSKPTYKNGILTGQTTNNVVTSVSSVAAVGGDPKSVTKQFRTVIKKTD